MIAQQAAHIYKADFRGVEKSDEYRCLSTLNYHDNLIDIDSPLGNLTVLEDETLAPKKRKFYYVPNDTVVIIVPLVGMLEIASSDNPSNQFVVPEEIVVMPMQKGNAFTIINPYEKELINFLQIRIKTNSHPQKKYFGGIPNNTLHSIFKSKDCYLEFGVFDGRKEGVYRLNNKFNTAFTFVINGAFEIENRLLENRDGLSLSNKNFIEFEALSENAIILIIESPSS